jgi:Holliday junction resolvasome RuvABC ATP-dependent DNA helicase subunit
MEICLNTAQAPLSSHILTPAQQPAAESLRRALTCGNVLILQGDIGQGKTTVLRDLQTEIGGVLLGMREFIRALDKRNPFALEEAWIQLVESSLEKHDLVIFDDVHLIAAVVDGYSYPRVNLWEVAITAVLEHMPKGKKLVVAVTSDAPESIDHRAQIVRIGDFDASDYEARCAFYLGSRSSCLDYTRIYRFAPALNAHQLRTACGYMRDVKDLSTDAFIEYLGSQNLTSNVEIEEVEAVDWNDLKGVDDIIRALEVKIALPFEQHELAAKFELKPKRGVLLAGPPGTGKTTIGRALAHRLRSKFFLIDGTVIAGSRDFYCKIEKIFDSAKRNAPSIIFIDDADVIFEGENKDGLYRYLLTMLARRKGAASHLRRKTGNSSRAAPLRGCSRYGAVERGTDRRGSQILSRRCQVTLRLRVGTRQYNPSAGRILSRSDFDDQEKPGQLRAEKTN